MLMQVLILLAGLAMVVIGADALVSGASSVARRSGISEFIIGMTIVGFGTSLPELVVSLNGAIAGSSDISIGNVLGSNIFNTLLILGITAVIAPIAITRGNLRRDIPVCFAVTALFIGLGMLGGRIGRIDAAILLLSFAAYMLFCFRFSAPEGEDSSEEKTLGVAVSVIFIIAGLAGLVVGGRIFVDSAVAIAREIGVSQKFIAVTVLAGGTSLPELATCIVAAARRKGTLALGNILGSNIFNLLLIIGTAGLVRPLSFSGMGWIDITALLLSLVIVWAGAYLSKGEKIGRCTGTALLAAYAAYMTYIFITL